MASEQETRDSKPTRRVVLKRERAMVIPAELTKDQQKAVAAALGVKVTEIPVIEAWVVVHEATGSKTQAIEAYAGKPGTPDAKIGAYRAPNLSAWSGGEVYDAPPLPLVQRRALDEVTS